MEWRSKLAEEHSGVRPYLILGFFSLVVTELVRRTNSLTLSGPCPVSVRTSSDIRSKRPARYPFPGTRQPA